MAASLRAALFFAALSCSLLPALAQDAASYLASGNQYAAQQKYAEALAAYSEAARLAPASAEAWYGVGWSYYHLGRYRQALDPLTRAVRLNPRYRDAATALGETQLALLDLGAAEATFRKMLRVTEDYSALFGLARALAYQKRYPEAQPYAERAILQRADLPRPRVLLARIYRGQNRLPEAESTLLAAAALDPAYEPTLREQLSLYQSWPGRLALARGPLYALLVRHPQDKDLLQAQVDYARAAEPSRLPLALEQLAAVLPAPSALPCREELARLLLAQQRYAEAEVQLRLVLAVPPPTAAALAEDAALLAQALEAQDRAPEAAQLLADYSRTPAYRRLLAVPLAEAQLLALQPAAALATAESALAGRPMYSDALRVAAAAAGELARWDLALTYQRRLVASLPYPPSHPEARGPREGLARALARSGRRGEALIQYQLLRAVDSERAAAAQLELATAAGNAEYELFLWREQAGRWGARGLAECLLEQGRPAEADLVLRAALRTQPDAPDLLELRARVLRALGRGSEVGPLLERALARTPGDAGLNRERGLWLLASGQPQAALGALQRSLSADPLSATAYAALVEAARQSGSFAPTAAFLITLAEPETPKTALEAPAASLTLIYLARLWEAEGGKAEAARKLRALSDRLPARVELARAAAAASERAGDYAAAARYYGRAARDPEAAPRSLRLAVMCLSRAGDLSTLTKTAATYLSAVARDPGALALAVEMEAAVTPPTPAAISALVGLVEAEPDSFEYHGHRLALFAARGRLDTVTGEYAARAATRPSPTTALALAQAQALSGAPRQALATLQAQPAPALADAEVTAFHVRLLRQAGDTAGALAALEPARAAQDPRLSLLRAEALAAAGRSQEALAEYARALSLGADAPTCLEGISRLWSAGAVSLEAVLAAAGQAHAALLDPASLRQFVVEKLPGADPAVSAWLLAHPAPPR